jgi:hypothetical protein
MILFFVAVSAAMRRHHRGGEHASSCTWRSACVCAKIHERTLTPYTRSILALAHVDIDRGE